MRARALVAPLTLLVALLALLLTVACAGPSEAEQHYNKGTLLLDDYKFDEAVGEFDRAIELDPDLAVAYAGRALANLNWRMYYFVEPQVDANKAIELDPDLASAYVARGIAHLTGIGSGASGGLRGAVAEFDHAIELEPGAIDAYVNRGVAYHHLGQSDRAIADYDRAIELDPNEAQAYRNRGYTYLRLGKEDEALADFSKAIEVDPDYALAYLSRGDVYRARGECERALAGYGKAIELDYFAMRDLAGQFVWEVYVSTALCHISLGHWEEAKADVDRELELNDVSVMGRRLRGLVRLHEGDSARALADLKWVVSQYPDPSQGRAEVLADLESLLSQAEHASRAAQIQGIIDELKGP